MNADHECMMTLWKTFSFKPSFFSLKTAVFFTASFFHLFSIKQNIPLINLKQITLFQ